MGQGVRISPSITEQSIDRTRPSTEESSFRISNVRKHAVSVEKSQELSAERVIPAERILTATSFQGGGAFTSDFVNAPMVQSRVSTETGPGAPPLSSSDATIASANVPGGTPNAPTKSLAVAPTDEPSTMPPSFVPTPLSSDRHLSQNQVTTLPTSGDLAIPTTSDREHPMSSAKPHLPTSEGAVTDCLNGKSRKEYFFDILSNYTSAGTLADDETPQGAAFAYLFEDDAYMADPCLVTTPVGQRFGLITFYFSTNGHNWTENAGWLWNVPECEWYGVRCDTSEEVLALEQGRHI